jgi:hypothetical protein
MLAGKANSKIRMRTCPIILEPIADQPFRFDAIFLGFMGATMTSMFWINHHHSEFVERGSQ